ncbi:MAG TPA: DUF924 family protein, partial [Nannocystaceae bacterium]|nr:DUF924 family protein [Nannocystaceae bacterium]
RGSSLPSHTGRAPRCALRRGSFECLRPPRRSTREKDARIPRAVVVSLRAPSLRPFGPCSVFADTMTNTTANAHERAQTILDYWFGAIDDTTPLNREREPFALHFQRWYGKSAEVDASIRAAFAPHLHAVTASGQSWDATLRQWRRHPRGLLALTILLDQLPRNMYRDTARMYTHDALGLLASEAARAQLSEDLPLVHRMFIAVPLMHTEDLILQERMLAAFEEFVELATTRSPDNVGFFRFALDYAKRHVDVIRAFGRFPHRNALLGRTSTPEELTFLERRDAWF